MSHLVRCRGGEWRIWQGHAWMFVSTRYGNGHDLNWNGITQEPYKGWDTPAWLPVAWLCCEADPAEGPGFAEAILDAEPGDDAPALIACDWLEERGARGECLVEAHDGYKQLPKDHPGIPCDNDKGQASYYWAGPLASWCRHLIATRCVACGGRRDGTNEVPTEIYLSDCPLCGYPAHPTPPALAIPEVVK